MFEKTLKNDKNIDTQIYQYLDFKDIKYEFWKYLEL